jgi:predicted amidohydrolase
MKIALAQFNPTLGDFEGNRSRILELAQTAKYRHVSAGLRFEPFW